MIAQAAPTVPGTIDYVSAVALLVISALVAGASVAVVRLHASALRNRPGSHGLLSWHVVAIASAGTGLWVLLALAQLDSMGILHSPRPVRLCCYVACGVLWLIALGIIAKTQRLKVTKARTRDRTDEGDRT